MKLTQKDRDKLWGESGPYTEVKLIFETRILDDRVSRIFILVEVYINPLTFEIIKKNRKLFTDDPIINEFLDQSEYQGQSFGYVVCPFTGEYRDDKVLKEAKRVVEDCKNTIIKMHKFVLNNISEKDIN